MTYITQAETNKFIRQALAEMWPKVKFRVYISGGSTDVEWWDGPSVAEVEQVTKNFEGQSFDGMQDLATPIYGIHPVTKEKVHWGADYIHEHRKYTVPFYTRMAQIVCDRYGLPLPEIKTSTWDQSAHVAQDHSVFPGGGSYTLSDLIYQEAHKTSDSLPAAKSEAKAKGSSDSYRAVKVDGGWEIHNTRFEDADTFRQYKDTLGFRWNKDDRKDRFWMCPVEKLPDDIQALVDGAAFDEVVENLKADNAIKAITYDSPADKFRKLAVAMQKLIDEKRHPATANQNPTRRRMDIIAGMAQDADRLERVQSALLKLADAWDTDTVPEVLKGVLTRATVEWLLFKDYLPSAVTAKDDFKRLLKAGIGTPHRFSDARFELRELLKDIPPKEMTTWDKIAAIKRDLIGTNIEGFIPTPSNIVDQMLAMADIQTGMRVLEPSAGWGNIADAVKDQHPDAIVHCVEPVLRLRDILELKGHELVAYQIFNYDVKREDMYDRVVMNPPFEDEQDIEHVQYVYEQFLKEGGKLVAIMSEHGFFANSKQSKAFREWLEEIGGTSEKLPPDAFKANGYRVTGVQTRIVMIEKPVYVPTKTVDIVTIEQPVKAIDPLVKAQRDYAKAAMSGDIEDMKEAARILREAIAQKEQVKNA